MKLLVVTSRGKETQNGTEIESGTDRWCFQEVRLGIRSRAVLVTVFLCSKTPVLLRIIDDPPILRVTVGAGTAISRSTQDCEFFRGPDGRFT